jgi:hypothetical protein
MTEGTLKRIYKMLNSPDKEMRSLGMILFYQEMSVWERDIYPEYRDFDCEVTKARCRIFSRRYLKKEL